MDSGLIRDENEDLPKSCDRDVRTKVFPQPQVGPDGGFTHRSSRHWRLQRCFHMRHETFIRGRVERYDIDKKRNGVTNTDEF